MSHPTLKEKKKIPNLFGMSFETKNTRRGEIKLFKRYIYAEYKENLPSRPKTNVFIPDFEKDWSDGFAGWPVEAVVEEGKDYVEVIGDKWESATC